MQRRKLLVDLGGTGLALGATLAILATRGFGTPDPASSALDTTGVALAVLSCAPLLVRRLAPGTCYAVTALASLLLLLAGYPLDAPVAAVIAAYGVAVAYGGEPSGIRRIPALLAVAGFVPAVAASYASVGVNLWGISTELLAWAAVFAGAWVAGDRARLRVERMAHLEERTRRTERESDRERRLAVAEERTRIARELHDSAGHAINVILVQAGAARLLHAPNPAASRAAIATIEEVARDTIGEIDRIVRALRDDDGPEPPLPTDHAALDALVERHRAAGLSVAARVSPPTTALPRSVAWAAYRILQEALTNAARHGRGSADVAVRAASDAVEITVTNPTADRRSTGGGHGIVGMRERATLLGGTLEAVAADGTFRLHARLPHTGPAR